MENNKIVNKSNLFKKLNYEIGISVQTLKKATNYKELLQTCEKYYQNKNSPSDLENDLDERINYILNSTGL